MRGLARRNRSWFIPGSGANHHGARRSAIPILLALMLALSGAARAQDAPVEYSQRGIPAEASAENGVVARDRALASARRIAWERLSGALGGNARALPDSTLEGLVESIVIEQERTAPTRYTGRVTVNFSRSRVQAAVGGGDAAAGGAPGGPAAGANTPAVTSVVAVARYGGMSEWLELRRRLATAPQIARVEVVAIAIDRARLRLSLRAPAPAAAEQLAQSGIILAPQAGVPPQIGAPPADAWRVGLAGRS